MSMTRFLPALVLCCGLSTACSERAAAPAASVPTVVPATPPRTEFAAKTRIPVRLQLKPTAQGGRIAPIAGGYRPTVVFAASGTSTVCGVARGDVAQVGPGETHEVALRCQDAVRVPTDARGFSLLEEGREIGNGVVLP